MHVACDLVLTSKSTISHVEGLRLQFLGIDITNAYGESILYQLQMTEVNNNGLINSFNDATRAIQLINKNNSNISWQLEWSAVKNDQYLLYCHMGSPKAAS